MPWDAEAKGRYHEATRPKAGEDFADNRAPGGDNGFGTLTAEPELDNGTRMINSGSVKPARR